jgi:hypothetical protein
MAQSRRIWWGRRRSGGRLGGAVYCTLPGLQCPTVLGSPFCRPPSLSLHSCRRRWGRILLGTCLEYSCFTTVLPDQEAGLADWPVADNHQFDRNWIFCHILIN